MKRKIGYFILFLCIGHYVNCNHRQPGKPEDQKYWDKESGFTENDSKPYSDVRLPEHVKPKHYNVFLDVDMETKVVNGTTKVLITVTKPTKYLYLHAFDYLSITGKLYNSQNKSIPIPRQLEYKKNQYFVMDLSEQVPAGTYILQYVFSYRLKKKLAGFYQAKYKGNDGKIKTAAVTQFQPTDARLAFPCFDEPGMRASFDITIGHDWDYIAISNMPVEKRRHDKTAKRKYDTFQTTPLMSTYILSFVVCKFAHVTVVTAKTKNPVKMTFYVPPAQLGQIKYATRVGREVLSSYERFFNVSYPLPKADMIAVPDFALNGMENWGLVSCRLKGLLYDPQSSPLSSKIGVAALISHELAHQWFGNLVTMEWWSDLWLNEGFASYMTFKGVDAVEPGWRYPDFQVVHGMVTAMNLDALVSSHPIYVKVSNPAQINEIFDAISYKKGGSVLRMLENFLGPETFVKGLSAYLKKYAYGNAKSSDLWEELSKASRLAGDNYNVSEIMNTWILQMGFPVVDVTKTANGTFKLSQSRFFADRISEAGYASIKSPYGYKWFIPFNYFTIDTTNISSKSRNKRIWLKVTDSSIHIKSNNAMVLGNAGRYGFYRVNYDYHGWRKIITTLKRNHLVFDATERAGLLQDAFALAAAGRVSYFNALDLLDYIDRETDYITWKAASDSIDKIRLASSQSQRSLEHFKRFMRSKISKLYAKYGFKEEKDFLKRHLQILIAELACRNDHENCRNEASEMFRKWMKTGKIPSDFKRLAYFYGVYTGDEREWNFVLKHYLRTKIASEKATLLYALCGTRHPALIDKMLHYTLNSSVVKSQDAFYVYRYIAENSAEGRYHTWYFLKENWRAIVKRFSHQFHSLERILRSVVSGFTTKHSLEQAKEFFTEERMKGAEQVRRTLKQTLEEVAATCSWLDANKRQIEQWFMKKAKRVYT